MTEQKEIWRDIKGYEGLYQVSNLGNVKSLTYKNTKQIRNRRPYKNKNGYLRVELSKNGKKKKVSIHRLVAQAFILNTDNKPEVNHKNGIKADNRADNLEWVEPKENIRHAIISGLTQQRGQDSPNAKLTNEQARKIREEYIPRDRKYSAYALARKYGVSATTIQYILHNKTYK